MDREERDIMGSEESGMVFPQPDTNEIIAWVKDGPDPEEQSIYCEELEPEMTTTVISDQVSDLSLSRGDDLFSNRTMPKRVHWSVPWSDLMMTMFILFVVMYIYHSAKKEFLSPDGLRSENSIHYPPSPPTTNDESDYGHQTTLPKLFDLSRGIS